MNTAERFYNFDYDSLPTNEVSTVESQPLLKLDNYSDGKGLVIDFFTGGDSTRINIVNRNMFTWFEQDLAEYRDDMFSWIVMMAEKEQCQPPNLTASKALEYRKTEKLDVPIKDFLLHAWREDYIESILKSYPSKLKTNQLESFQSRLDKGVHLLFYHQDVLIGHGCYSIGHHPVLDIDCSYWHQWIAKHANREQRSDIHHVFFQQLFSTGLPAMSGVALANAHGLRHCIKNGFLPTLLSIRKLAAGGS